MKKLLICLMLLSPPTIAQVIPETAFDCEVSDTSDDNVFSWNLRRAESRYLRVNYLQYGTNMNLAGATNGLLYLKASDSTNRYSISGTIYTTGYVRVLWPFTNAVPAATYTAEFGCSQSNELNLAARGKIKVTDGTGSTAPTTTPWYVVYTETDPIWIAAKTAVDAQFAGLSTTQGAHTVTLGTLQTSNNTHSAYLADLRGRTSSWEQAVNDGTNWQTSIAKLIVAADTQRWNTAGLTATAVSNEVDDVQSRTQLWDQAVLDGTNWITHIARLITGTDTSNWNKWLTESNQYARLATDNTFTGSNQFNGAVSIADSVNLIFGNSGYINNQSDKITLKDSAGKTAFALASTTREVRDTNNNAIISMSESGNILNAGVWGTWRSTGDVTNEYDIVNKATATNWLSTTNPQGFAKYSETIGSATTATYSAWANNASNVTDALTNYFRNGANITNTTALSSTYIVTNIINGGINGGDTGGVVRTANNDFTVTFPTNYGGKIGKGSFCFQITTNVAPANYAMSGVLEYPIVITNLSAWEGDLQAFVADLATVGETNPASRSLVYTGLTYTASKVAATNSGLVAISVPAGRSLLCVVTNGSISNAFIKGWYTW